MSKQQDNNDLSQGVGNIDLNRKNEQRFNPNSASSFQPSFNPQAQNFVPGQYQESQSYQNYQGYQSYQQNQGFQAQPGYQQPYQQGYQAYQGYNNFYQPPAEPQTKAMSLEDYNKQKEQSKNSLNAKPKRTLKLSSSSGIKIGGKKEEPKTETKPETKTEAKTDPKPAQKEEPKVEVPKAKSENKIESNTESKTDSKAGSKTESKSASKVESKASLAADTLPKEDDINEEVINDLFGGKDHISILFMGHVDAGKSTMGGNLLYLTGSVDKRTIDKYEKEAKDAGRQGWYLSWVMDTNKEERNDGKTIEVGRAYFETEKRRYTILDAPGHKMYVSEMIGGASQADVGILVISARKGEYETGFEKGGQTREHALLAMNQGVSKLAVVVNKMDDTTVNWSKERYDECTAKLAAFLKAIGYKKEDVLFMPVSGYTGAGLKEPVNPTECPWYKGPTLLSYLDSIDIQNRKVNGPFMLPIAGKMKDLGTVVEGKIESGHIKKGSTLIMMPNRVSVEVLTIYNETEEEADQAISGEQVRLRIKGVEEEDVSNGYVLTSPNTPIKTVTRFEAQIAFVELPSIVSTGFSCVMHVHTAIEEVTIVQLKHKLEKGTNRRSKKPPAFAKKGMKVIAVLETPEPVCVETYEDYHQLGRFTLRDQGATIAIGKITKLL
ncbi:Translation termination factor eRF3 [Komagataella phaffii]|nr:GQ67_03466T0 [Komagataella phaffii]AOA68720.1 GQ68_03436T0 [Komagataella phaffii GS115]